MGAQLLGGDRSYSDKRGPLNYEYESGGNYDIFRGVFGVLFDEHQDDQ